MNENLNENTPVSKEDNEGDFFVPSSGEGFLKQNLKSTNCTVKHWWI